MNTHINLVAIIIANLMAIVLFFGILISKPSIFELSHKHSKILLVMMISCFVSCIIDPLCFFSDGKIGFLNYLIVFWGNTWLYLSNIIVTISWFFLISIHLNIKISKIHKNILFLTIVVFLISLFINIFIPIVFSVSNINVYSRSSLNWIYYIIHLLLLLDGVILYYRTRNKSEKIKFFPILVFIIPVIIGIGLQGVFYGVSTITPFTMIALACLISSLQNEFVFTDKLTGLYNRYYLDALQRRVNRYKSQFTIMMLDINHFKSINDIYGHNTGDKALKELANVLKNSIKNGEILRYAGDEFIVVINTQDEKQVEQIVFQIHQSLKEFNKSSNNPYELSVSLGYGDLDLKKYTMEDLLDIIDKKMYINKEIYHKNIQSSVSDKKK